MACLNKSNNGNFLTWHKVSGSLTLAQLQASGLPDQCDNTKVDAPTSVSATANSSSQITITWTSNESSFIIRRGTTSGSLTQIDTPSASPYIDTGLTEGTEYFYDVIAVSGALQSDPSSEASGVTFPDFKEMVVFDGSNDFAIVGPIGSPIPVPSKFTVSVWWRRSQLRTATSQSGENLFGVLTDGGTKGWTINNVWYNIPNKNSIQVGTVGLTTSGTSIEVSHDDDFDLHNYVMVVDTTVRTIDFYSDGAFMNQASYATDPTINSFDYLTQSGGSLGRIKAGVTEVRVVNSALTAQNITDEWNDGNGGAWIKTNISNANHIAEILYNETTGTNVPETSTHGNDLSLGGFDPAIIGYGTQLTVSSESGTPNVGDLVTGGTSGATGLVVSHVATDLEIEQVKGVFQAAETVTSTGYSAIVDSALRRSWDKT